MERDYVSLERFIEFNKDDMLIDLTRIVTELKRQIRANPEDYTEPGSFDDDPHIDIRLCIDIDYEGTGRHDWIFRTGLVDYDQYHSEYCSASCVGLATVPKELLDDLIEQLE